MSEDEKLILIDNRDFQLYKEKINKEISDSIHEYVRINSDSSCLDGWYTAEELRRIADKMDELKEKEKDMTN